MNSTPNPLDEYYFLLFLIFSYTVKCVTEALKGFPVENSCYYTFEMKVHRLLPFQRISEVNDVSLLYYR